MGMWDVFIDGVQDLLLHLADGVTVQHLHLDLWGLLILWVDTVYHLDGKYNKTAIKSPPSPV